MKPENVCIQRPDGTEIPCDLVHVGYDTDEDLDHWDAVTEVPFRPGVDILNVGVLPARTTISLRVIVDTESPHP